MISPLQGLSDEHLLLGKEDKVAPSAKDKEVVAIGKVYIKAALYLMTSVIVRELKPRILIRATYTKAAVAADIVDAIYVRADIDK